MKRGVKTTVIESDPVLSPTEKGVLTVEQWPIDRPIPYARNARKLSTSAVDKIAASLQEFGWRQPIVVDAEGVIIVGHTRLLAAKKLGMATVPVHVAANLTPAQVKAYRLMDNRSHQETDWDMELLGPEFLDLQGLDIDLSLTGFDSSEIDALLAEPAEGLTDPDAAPEPPEAPVTIAGDLWLLGPHRVLCGDCRDFGHVQRLLGAARANLVVTSPPYASQRKYDESSGFRPIPPDEYTEWFRDVASNISTVLTDDGSYFLNIKEHCDEGQRHLYVKDLTIAHVREWGWLFVDEFCWRDKKNGVPGGWPNRFKDAWEPVFQFCKRSDIKFRPMANAAESEAVFEYSPETAKTRTGSGLLGEKATQERQGMARPSNVLEIAASSSSGHSAAFPVELPAWFVRAYTDPSDSVFDPFMGSGSTLMAAEKNGRVGYGTELSPAYCDVIVRRWQDFTGKTARLESTGQTFEEVKFGRRLGAQDALKEEALAQA